MSGNAAAVNAAATAAPPATGTANKLEGEHPMGSPALLGVRLALVLGAALRM